MSLDVCISLWEFTCDLIILNFLYSNERNILSRGDSFTKFRRLQDESHSKNVYFFSLAINRPTLINRDLDNYATDYDMQLVEFHPNT